MDVSASSLSLAVALASHSPPLNCEHVEHVEHVICKVFHTCHVSYNAKLDLLHLKTLLSCLRERQHHMSEKVAAMPPTSSGVIILT